MRLPPARVNQKLCRKRGRGMWTLALDVDVGRGRGCLSRSSSEPALVYLAGFFKLGKSRFH